MITIGPVFTTNQLVDVSGRPIGRMSLKEFREFGYLQEVNRRFFHPLGLMMTTGANPADGSEYFTGIQDGRSDPVGFVYDKGCMSGAAALRVAEELKKRHEARTRILDDYIQTK